MVAGCWKNRDALAHKNSLLTKRREPKPTNSACAEFANQNADFIGGKTFQGENRQTIPRIRLRRILEFCAFAKKNAVSLTNQGRKGCQNEALCSGKQKLCVTKNRHNYPKNSAQAEFLCFCVFAEKNAVYLANQSCKDGKSEALCHKKPA